jgi:glyoxylase-like metal-dependent hydrolase (beta-lactamase superfamily II)
MRVHRPSSEFSVINDDVPVPGVGSLPINAFVLHAQQPLVVDTGVSLPDRDFMDTLASVIAPEDVEWIWLTHPDRDHTGALFDLLAAAPRARVVTTFLGAGIMSLERPIPMDRVFLLNPGQQLDVGDRVLTALRPPLFDSPATMGFFEPVSRTLVSSDCFGAPLSTGDLAAAEDVRAVAPADLRAGQLLWASVDSPWVHLVDPAGFHRTVEPLRRLRPAQILSSHLPPVVTGTEDCLDVLGLVPGSPPFVGPDQSTLEAMLAGFEPEGLEAAAR